jgi:fructosamine-3-kinase
MPQSRLSERIFALTDKQPVRITALAGGCVGDVFTVTLADGQNLVAKVGDTPHSGLALEGRMLNFLAAHTKLPVPLVLFADERLLLMEKLESDQSLGTKAERHAARLIAALHDITPEFPHSTAYGFDFDTVIGGLHQPNPWTQSWLAFFAQQRLMHMAREGERAGRLPTATRARVERLAEALDRWLEEPDQPALIHGDLWGGNILSAEGRITGFIDPALYYADPEIELAFTTLFGTFGDAFFGPYQEIRPIKPGFFEERRDIYNLYPLLVHVRLFGGSYVGSVERTLARFGF